MESGIRDIFLSRGGPVLLLLALGSGAAAAQPGNEEIVGGEPVFDPSTERRVIEEARIDAQDIEIGGFAGLLSIEDFGTDTVVGATLGYHVTEDIFVETQIGQSEAGRTSFELLAGNVVLLTDEQRDYRFYNLSLGYHLLPGESFIGGSRAFNSAMYIIGGIGATEFAGDDRFTWSFGVGYRLLFTDWLAMRVDIRDHVFDIDVIGQDKTSHNIAIHGGLTAFF